MRERKEIEEDFKQALVHPLEPNVRIYQKLTLEVLLDMRNMMDEIGHMVQGLTEGRE